MKFLFLIGICFLILKGNAQSGRVVYLENDKLRVGVLPGTGGRIVYFGLKGKGNILKADASLWTEPESEKSTLGEVDGYKAYHGNIVWPSPMSEWWTKQNFYPEKRDRGDRWPPDPYLIYSAYKIITQDEKSLTWQSPDSPVSGIRITESIELKESNTMKFAVEFQNITDSVIHWGIWLNTRLDGRSRCFVKVASPGSVKIKDEEKLKKAIPWALKKSYFTFLPDETKMGGEKVFTKACITPEIPMIAAFSADQMLIIRTSGVEVARVHPQQSFIEIFNQVLPISREDLLELEFHSEYKKIEPGEIIKTAQEWTVFPCEKLKNDMQRIAFLKSKIY